MDIATADRLVQLRKANGLSQEALAASLGVSRQAVSKWERAEASPDTDNLIALASIYGMTLDQLLDTTKDKYILDEGEKEPEQKEEKLSKKIINKGKEYINNPLYPKAAKKMFKFPYPIIVVIAYLVICFGLKALGVNDPWGVFALLFLTIPMYYMVAAACRTTTKKGFLFLMPVPVAVVTVYLFMGMVFGAWKIPAILFLLIPLYYWYVIFYVKGGKKKENENSYKDNK